MHIWMDVMRELELVLDDYPSIFDAWEEGGVTGLVVGPLSFEAARLLPISGTRYVEGAMPPTTVYDPDPAVYQRFGVKAPPAPTNKLPERRQALERMLINAKDRGWTVLIFQAGTGAGPGGSGPLITDPLSQAAMTARMVDTLAHFPMVDGAVMDGPEWGYEIDESFYNRRSLIFDNLPPEVAPSCRALGYDYDALVAAKDRLYQRLHALTPQRVASAAAGGMFGMPALLGHDRDFEDWCSYRIDSLTHFYRVVREGIASELPKAIVGCGPRTASFAPLCGYDMTRLAEFMDILLPKHYFWHRGFDGLIGTVGRYVGVLTSWNPSLSDAEAFDVVESLFGLRLPGVSKREDLESALTADFMEVVVKRETRMALAAVDDPARIVPWMDAGRMPHDGDPITPGMLSQILTAASEVGLQHCLYHHAGNLTAGEWAVISAMCGQPWDERSSPYTPADQMVL
ncbi:MAG: hypothetical protein GXY52_01450 [Chloroflexi bacterium]|nr:hypothetical protein [Chloroflexota bacterium]